MTTQARSADYASFDPVEAFPYLKFTQRWKSGWMLGLWIVVVLAVAFSAHIQGTLGEIDDFRPWRDIATALGIPGSDVSRPSFPLLRDFTNLFLISVICWTVPVLHWQWRCMKNVVPSLVEAGVLKPKAAPQYKTIHVALGIRRSVEHRLQGDPLESLMHTLADALQRMGRYSVAAPVIGLLLAIVVAVGQRNNGVFMAYAGSASNGDETGWVSSAYENWWASIDYPLGFIVYYALLGLGVFLVIAQNSVGILAVWALVAFSAVADFDLDWADKDGNFGWASVSATQRTVAISLAMHGSALGLSLVALGSGGLLWGSVMVAVWVVMLPLVTLGPWYALRGISRTAQVRKIANCAGIQRAEVMEIRSCRARPLRIAQLPQSAVLGPFLILVLLPVILTGAQIYFETR